MSMSTIRLATLNLAQHHKRWDQRRALIAHQLAELHPDVFALNEICMPLQTGRWLQHMARDQLGLPFALVQQSKVNGTSYASGVCFNTPSADDPTLWPSDHAGVWADLAFV
jgi:hypothetical protein